MCVTPEAATCADLIGWSCSRASCKATACRKTRGSWQVPNSLPSVHGVCRCSVPDRTGASGRRRRSPRTRCGGARRRWGCWPRIRGAARRSCPPAGSQSGWCCAAPPLSPGPGTAPSGCRRSPQRRPGPASRSCPAHPSPATAVRLRARTSMLLFTLCAVADDVHHVVNHLLGN